MSQEIFTENSFINEIPVVDNDRNIVKIIAKEREENFCIDEKLYNLQYTIDKIKGLEFEERVNIILIKEGKYTDLFMDILNRLKNIHIKKIRFSDI